MEKVIEEKEEEEFSG